MLILHLRTSGSGLLEMTADLDADLHGVALVLNLEYVQIYMHIYVSDLHGVAHDSRCGIMCEYACIYTHMHIYLYMCVYIYIYIKYKWVYICINTYIYICY